MRAKVVIPETMEPAHFKIPELHDLLRELYTFVRDKYQEPISQAFDKTSRDIGFVLASTIPMTFQIGDNGQVRNLGIPDVSPFQGTLMDRGLTQALKPMVGSSVPVAKPGDYTIYLIWPQALKLKLRKDWTEPAHVYRPWLEPAHMIGPWTEPARPTRPGVAGALKPAKQAATKLVWESHEPAHWFNPAVVTSEMEAVHISLLNDLYPDLRLLERVTAARKGVQGVPPEVQEPAHYRQILSAFPGASKEMLEELTQVMRRHGY